MRLEHVRAISEAIRAAARIPSGHLYAMVLGTMSLAQYEAAIALLVRAGLVRSSGHLLEWCGPMGETS